MHCPPFPQVQKIVKSELHVFFLIFFPRCFPTLVPGTDYAQMRKVTQGSIHLQFNESAPIGQHLGEIQEQEKVLI